MGSEQKAVTLSVQSDDPKKDKDDKNKAKKKDKEKKDDISEEDKKLIEDIQVLVDRVCENDDGLRLKALGEIEEKLTTAQSSMTSVPKPLKFLRPHYVRLQEHYNKMTIIPSKAFLADILSVLAATIVPKDGAVRESLHYRLEARPDRVTKWGQEYIRNITREITAAYTDALQIGGDTTELFNLVREIVPYNMKHNAESEAIDLLSELLSKSESPSEMVLVEQLLKEHVDQNNSKRIVNYLLSLANFVGEERNKLLEACYDINVKMESFPDALRLAFKINSRERVEAVLRHPKISSVAKKQCAYMIHRHRFPFDFEDDALQAIASGEHLSSHFHTLAKDLDVLDPKLPEDIYKSHLEEKRTTPVLDSAKANLASTFVNAFVNAGFCNDSLMTVEGAAWLYKNKEHGMMSAAASLGPLLLWDVDGGLTDIDKFTHSNDENIKAGSLLAFGLVTAGVTNEVDPAWALLSEHLESEQSLMKLCAIVGLGFAYGGQVRDELQDNLTPTIVDTSTTLECSVMAAISLGLNNVGTCNADIADVILLTIKERHGLPNHLDNPLCAFFAVGLGLLVLGKQEQADDILSKLDALKKDDFTHPLAKYAEMTIIGCAYAGSGDVDKVHEMLQKCSEHITDEKESAFQSVAALNLGLIALGEEIGSDMVLRAMDHLLQYGESVLRRAVPLCLGLLFASNPKVTVVDLLSKLSHDADADVAIGAIFGMGLMGAGTNHARMAGLLRQLAGFYAKDANALFMVRIAQGMLYMGKGLMSLSPLHSDRLLINPVSLASLVVVLHSCLHLKSTFLGKHHYLLYHLIPAMHARMLMTLDEDGNVVPVNVRVGQAVDITGQAGRPKNITGFQTHTTPVLLGYGDRAELATDDYIAETSILEGFVIVRKNPNKDVEMADKDETNTTLPSIVSSLSSPKKAK